MDRQAQQASPQREPGVSIPPAPQADGHADHGRQGREPGCGGDVQRREVGTERFAAVETRQRPRPAAEEGVGLQRGLRRTVASRRPPGSGTT